MTGPDPREPGKLPDDPGDPQHGIVEELRHEVSELREGIEHAVEEAVEHVPKPVRWTVRKLVMIAALALVGLIVLAIVSALLYFANRTELVAHELTLLLNGALSSRSDVQIEIGDISGNPFRHVRIINARVKFLDGDAPMLLEAPWIELRYTPLQWLRPQRRTIDIVIEKPVIRISRDGKGKLRLPVWRAAGKPAREPSDFDVRLRVRDGSVMVAGPVTPVRGMQLHATASIGRASRAEIVRLSWLDGPFATRHLELSGRADAGDSVHIELSRMRTDDLALTGRAVWKKGKDERQIDLDIGHLPWKWLAEVTGNKSFDVEGEARGTVSARGYRTWDAGFANDIVWKDLGGHASGRARWDGGVLKLTPLTVVSKAGHLEGDVGWSRAGWNVGGAVEHGDPQRWGAFGVEGWPEGDVKGTFRYAVDTRRRESSAALTARLENSMLAGWRVDAGTVDVQFPAVGPDSFHVDATRRGGTFALRGLTVADGWKGTYRVADFPLDEWPDGRASGISGTMSRGEGTVEGRDGGLFVTGDLNGTSTKWLGMEGARWTLNGLDGALLPQPDLVARARLDDVMFLGIHFDSVATPFTLGDRTVALEDVRAMAGDTLMTMAGSADWDAGSWRLGLDRASAVSSQFAWTATPPVRFSGDAHGVTFERLVARDGDASLAINGRWAAPGGSYDWTGRAEGLDLGRLGLPVELQLSGRANALLRISGVAGDPRWTLAGTASHPGWQGHAADSIVLDLAGRPNQLEVRRGVFRLGSGTAEGSLAFEGMARAWPDTLTPLGVQQWLTQASRWKGEVRATALPLDELRELVPAAREWSGLVGGRIDINGSPKDPVLDLDLAAKPLRWNTVDADELKVQARYRAGRLDVPELRMLRGGRESLASGYMPLKLAMGSNPEVPETPMEWKVDIAKGDLSIFGVLAPQLGSAAGTYELKANVRGTPRHPDLDGTMKVRDGIMRMAGRTELFEGVSADIRLDESRITIDTLTARQGERGRVRASGSVELAGGGLKGYQFRIDGTELTTTEPGMYAAVFDGAFTVSDGPVVHGQRLPFVAGNVVVRRAVILYDFANVSETEVVAQSAAPLYWTYRINVEADNNVRWQPPDGDIEFSINLNVEQRPDALLIYGDMRALRGTYYFLSNRFTVNRADLTFDNVSGVNPVIDAEATTRVKSDDSPPIDVDIKVVIQGRAKEPVIALSSVPDIYDQPEILKQITVGRFVDKNGGPLGDPVDNYISRAINRTLSSELSRAFRGYISEWQIDRERGGLFAGEGGLIVGLGTQVTPKLSLRYRQSVPGLGRSASASDASLGSLERDIEAEYRLSRFIFVTTEVIQRKPGSATRAIGGPDINVNLKARWEY